MMKRNLRTGIVLLGMTLCLLGCAGRSGTLYIKPGDTEQLYVTGSSPQITVLNAGSVSVPVEIGSGSAASARDEIAPGVTRYWNPDGPRTFIFSNTSSKDTVLRYSVTGGEVSE